MPPIPKTQKKLREANFFLSRMIQAAGATNLETEDFEFYGSAFLNAGRSVTFFLQVEDKDNYDFWFPKWKEALGKEPRQLLAFMNEQRVAEVHEGGANYQAEIEYVSIVEAERNRHGHPAYGMHWFGPPGVPGPQIGQKVHYFRIGENKEKALATCQRYLNLLTRLVAEFEKACRENASK